jgi:hypothetical protein
MVKIKWSYAGGHDRNRSFSITIGNDLVHRSRAQEDYCLTEYEVTPPGKMPTCRDRPVCRIHMNYFGWPVTIGVEQNDELFKAPAHVCAITRLSYRSGRNQLMSYELQSSSSRHPTNKPTPAPTITAAANTASAASFTRHKGGRSYLVGDERRCRSGAPGGT